MPDEHGRLTAAEVERWKPRAWFGPDGGFRFGWTGELPDDPDDGTFRAIARWARRHVGLPEDRPGDDDAEPLSSD